MKFKNYLVFLTIMFIFFLANTVYSKVYKWGTGGPTGNYFGMANDAISYCNADLGVDKKGNPNEIEVVNSSGSEENLIGLTNKKFTISTVQEDVLRYHNRKSPNKINPNRIRLLADMHIETGHLLIPKNWQPKKKKKGGIFSAIASKFKKNKKEPISVNLLKGQVIGAWGGSIVSAEALSMFLELHMKVKETSLDTALTKANIPMLLVGGQPYAAVEKLLNTGKYILVGIDFQTLKARAPFYVEMNANYKQDGKMTTVPTFGVRALLLGKYFKSKTKNQFMKSFATCLLDNLGEMTDDDDANANWESVYELNQENNRIDWRYFIKMKSNDDDEDDE